MERQIVCLAKSDKNRPNVCIAGKDLQTGEWIRPVDKDESFGLSPQQVNCGGKEIELLDIIKIKSLKHKPQDHQTENFVIAEHQFEMAGKYPKAGLDRLLDNPGTLWVNEGQKNDRVSEKALGDSKIDNSLYLVKQNTVSLEVKEEFNEIKVRVKFEYNGAYYDLPLKDKYLYSIWKSKPLGIYEYPSKQIYLCISLTQPFKPQGHEINYCFKLVAGLISVD